MEINRSDRGQEVRGPVTKTTSPRAATSANLFTVTGLIEVLIYATCSVTLTKNDGSTIEVGTADSTAAILAQTAGDAIEAGDVWIDASPADVDTKPDWRVVNAATIIEKVTTDTITDGTLTYYAFWRPISAGANLVAA